MLNFGNVESGKTVTRIMHIRNSSDVHTTFQVHIYTYIDCSCNIVRVRY